MPECQFSLQETTIAPQTTIFLFTDGLNEAEDISHAQFGNQRIINVAGSLTTQDTLNPSVMVSKMAEEVHAFVGEAEPSDDLTMLAIKYL
jgi:sigma-B regulation protein RsbU (phosphoserine phosphatase)